MKNKILLVKFLQRQGIILKSWIKYKEIVLYLFFGVCTTIINVVVYFICCEFFLWNTILSTFTAWILSVIFAYFTNRTWVFESHAAGMAMIRELSAFFSCRLLSGGLDIAFMWIFVDVFSFPNMIMKLLSNIIVIVFNYIASKWIIFSKKSKQ